MAKDMNLYKQVRIVPRDAYWWRPKKILRTLKSNADTCPRCSSKLDIGDTAIPLDEKNVAIISGQKCQRCDCLYIMDNAEVSSILRDNINAKEYTLDGLPLWNYTVRRKEEIRKKQYPKLLAKKRKQLQNTSSGAVLLTVSSSSDTCDYIIINKKKEHDEGTNILHYSNSFALELLTAAFHKSRNLNGKYNGVAYRINDIVYPQSRDENLSESFLPTTLSIKHGGGMYSRTVGSEESKEIVNVLLYSPFTERYEVIFATYDKFEYSCYTDASLYRAFVATYGKPDITTCLGDRDYFASYDKDWSDLQDASPLHHYGYSVSEKEGLSDRYRQELLAELVDLELIEIPRIVKYLDFFISSHPSPSNQNAREKWQSDKAFISVYKANPARFLIKL